MNRPWRIEMFGRLRVCQADREITRFKTHKTGALLAYLAFYSQRSHTREALIDRFWPDADLNQGRPSLSVALSSLRHQLEPPGTSPGSVLITTNTEIRLNPEAYTSDVAEFESLLESISSSVNSADEVTRLTQAVELYRGELLPGYYEDWCCLERDRLQSLSTQALRRLVRGLVKERALPQAIAYAEKAVATDPLQEELHRDLMQLYQAVGQPSRALRQYREMEERWQQELGERPAAATRRLAQEIAEQLQQTPETASPGSIARPKPASPTTVTPPLPTGMQTFLAIAPSVSQQREKLSEEVAGRLRNEARAHGGQAIPGPARRLLLAFARAADAQNCAVAVQRRLAALEPELLGGDLRLALHTADADDETCLYRLTNHLDALLNAAHDGQILCSEEAAVFLRRSLEPEVRLRDLGRWRLQDSAEPVSLFAIVRPGEMDAAFPPPRAESAHTPNLPMQFTRFFGRQPELERLRTLLTSAPPTRLVTLTGPGGSGKTRLAIEAAHQQTDVWRGAIWFVSLAHVQEESRIAGAILEALKLPDAGKTDALSALQERLGRQPSLLVLDNLEQVAEGAAPFIAEMLEQIPSLSCLATSRQRLQIAAERELVVQPLPIPAGDSRLESVVGYESVQLFMDRAQAVKPDFQITTHNAAAIAELCNQLEGLPLALELAAARAQVLTPAQMLAQLKDRFAFLTSRRRDVPERHRMLRAAVDWSYQLLDADLRRFFVALSVFQNGWPLEAASDVCEEEQALDALCQLQECSLIVLEESATGNSLRFRMLQTLRAFGAEQATFEEHRARQKRHAAYFARFAEEAQAHLAGEQQSEWLPRLEQEHENLRAALAYLLEVGQGQEAAQLCLSLCEFWERHGWLREAGESSSRCLALYSATEESQLRRRLLGAMGWFAYLQGRHPEAQTWQQRNLEECARAQDHEGECIAWNNLGLIAQAQGQIQEAWRCFEHSLALARRQGDRARQAARLSNLGLLATQQDRYDEARNSLEEALAIYRGEENAYGVAACLCNIAKLVLYQGVYGEAETLAGESLRLFQEAGDRSGAAYALANLGLAKTLHGDQESAAACVKQALETCQETGLYSLTPVLLETRAKNEAARARYTAAAIALSAAERFRKDLQMPRNAFEEQTVAGLHDQFVTVLQSSELQRERVKAASLSLDQVLVWILNESGGNSE